MRFPLFFILAGVAAYAQVKPYPRIETGAHAALVHSIDVDGAELGVLAGARRLLVDSRPHVILETHSAELEDGCAQLLIEAGYAPRVVTQRRILPQNRPAEHNRWLVADRAWGHASLGDLQENGCSAASTRCERKPSK